MALGAAFVMFAIPHQDYEARFLDLNSSYPPSGEKENAFFTEKNKGYVAKSSLFVNIPNHAITYSFSSAMLSAFAAPKIEKYIISDGQTKTGNNDLYMRNIWEVERKRVGKGEKWALIAKGEIRENGTEMFLILLIGAMKQESIIEQIKLRVLHQNIFGLEKEYAGTILQQVKDLLLDIYEKIHCLKQLHQQF